MVQCCCCVIECCAEVEKKGPTKNAYERMCACCADQCSFRKCMDVVPWWPIVAIILLITSGSFILSGVGLVVSSVGVTITSTMGLASQGVVLAVILVDLIFVYSVCSNKLRVHNVHWNAEGCRGYRIKDGAGCCSKLLRCICKFYNFVMVAISWTSLLAILVLTIILSWFSGITLFLVALCELSQPAIDTLLNATMQFDAVVGEESPLGDFMCAPSTLESHPPSTHSEVAPSVHLPTNRCRARARAYTADNVLPPPRRPLAATSRRAPTRRWSAIRLRRSLSAPSTSSPLAPSPSSHRSS